MKLEKHKEVWNILIDLADKRDTITYGELAKRIEVRTLNVIPILSFFQKECIIRDLPPITRVVVNKDTKIPGSRYIVRSKDMEADLINVFEFDWSMISI